MHSITILFIGAVLLADLASAGRCSYREAKRPEPLEIRPRRCTGAGSFIGEDYWTTIGYDGSFKDGRQKSDFLKFDQSPVADGYVAYWITRSRYGNTHYEAFGHATIRPDGRVCAWFVGLDKEIIDVCGGFRVLSRSRYRPHDENPFEWTQAHLDAKSTLGFHEHRIAKYEGNDEVIYGDARIQTHSYQGVSGRDDEEEKSFIEVKGRDEFAQRVWLLRRKPGMPAPVLYQTVPRNSYSDERRQHHNGELHPSGQRYQYRNPDQYNYQQQQQQQQQQQHYQQQYLQQQRAQHQYDQQPASSSFNAVDSQNRANQQHVGHEVRPVDSSGYDTRTRGQNSDNEGVRDAQGYLWRNNSTQHHQATHRVHHGTAGASESQDSNKADVVNGNLSDDIRAHNPHQVGHNTRSQAAEDSEGYESRTNSQPDEGREIEIGPADESTIPRSDRQDEEGNVAYSESNGNSEGYGHRTGTSTRHQIGHGARPSNADDQATNNVEDRRQHGVNSGVSSDVDDTQRFARIQPPHLIRDQYGNTYEKRGGYYYLYSDPHIQNVRINSNNAANNNQHYPQDVHDSRNQDENYRRHMETLRRMNEERRQHEERRRQLEEQARREDYLRRVAAGNMIRDDTERTTYVGGRVNPQVSNYNNEIRDSNVVQPARQTGDGWHVQEMDVPSDEQQPATREDASEDPVPFEENEDNDEAEELNATPPSKLPTVGPVQESAEDKQDDWLF